MVCCIFSLFYRPAFHRTNSMGFVAMVSVCVVDGCFLCFESSLHYWMLFLLSVPTCKLQGVISHAPAFRVLFKWFRNSFNCTHVRPSCFPVSRFSPFFSYDYLASVLAKSESRPRGRELNETSEWMNEGTTVQRDTKTRLNSGSE
jgi:hypothetical protein